MVMMTAMPERSATANRVRFLAEVAGRLVQLPAPYPDLAMLSVALPNLDAFRETYGDPAAEQLLHGIFAAVQNFVPDALLGQIGEGQFAVTYEFDSAWANAREFAQDLRAVVGAASVGKHFSLAGAPQIGVVTHSGRPPLGTSLDVATELLRRANLAARMAADRGDGGIFSYSAAENDRIRNDTLLDHALRRAITGDEFRLHYQPVVDLQTLDVVGLEALLRWETQGGGLRDPQAFMAVAEASGLMLEIGASVIDLAVRQMRAWAVSGWIAPRLAINVADAQLRHPDFLPGIVAALAAGEIDPDHLELDISEAHLKAWSGDTRRQLAVLRDMNVTLALDDFGAGGASLQSLRELPVSKLKIDRGFIAHIATEPRDRAIIASIVTLGQELGLEIIAKGVEEPSQVAALLACGCRVGQGFLFCRPQPAAELPRLDVHRGNGRPAGRRLPGHPTHGFRLATPDDVSRAR